MFFFDYNIGQVRNIHIGRSIISFAQVDWTYTLMVVVKWTSAPVTTLTRRRTALLNAEERPTLPFTAELGTSIEAVVSIDVVDV